MKNDYQNNIELKRLMHTCNTVIFYGLLFFATAVAYGQATYTDNPTDNDILTTIEGDGVTLSNPLLESGDRLRNFAIFSNGITGAGLSVDSGLHLTSGFVTEAFSSNTHTEVTNSAGINYTDPDLVAIDPEATYDTVVFSFDVTLDPSITDLRVSFQFGSDEYPNYVGSIFNDVFGFFVSGPGIIGTQNMAVVPGTSTPIRVNTINDGIRGCSDAGEPVDTSNTVLYINNGHTTGGACNTNPGPFPIFSEYNGFTTLIHADLTGLIPGATYRLKLAIADAADDTLDSGVFISGISSASSLDRSDAPASYGDTQHVIVSGVYMGAGDPDADSVSLAGASTDATGDDTDNTDDEDGVTLPASFTQSATETVSVTVAGAGGYLQGWIDWDNNGTFDIGEEIAIDIQDGGAGDTDATANGTIVLDVTVPATATVGTSFARIRWSTDDVATLGGAATAMTTTASDGEVEDYQVNILAAPCSITDAAKTLETCNDNGTTSDGSDDYITFSLDPTGTDLGTTYSLSVDNGGTVTLAGGGAATGIAYGTATAFRLQNGSADGATTYTITITDDTDGSCTIDIMVIQNSCSSPSCTNVLFILDDSGSIDGAERADMINSVQALADALEIAKPDVKIANVGYAATYSGGKYYDIRHGFLLNPTITHPDTGSYSDLLPTTIQEMQNDGVFSGAGVLAETSAIFIFTDGERRSDFDSELIGIPTSPLGPSLDYGEYIELSTMFGGATISVFRVGLRGGSVAGIEQGSGILDEGNASFVMSPAQIAAFVNSFSCAQCALTDAAKTLETCNDNGTTSDTSDDYITFSLNPTGTDLGTTYSLSVDNGGTVTLAGGGAATGITYGTATAFRLQNGSADGATTYTITITDDTDGSCNIFTTVNQTVCSIDPCDPIASGNTDTDGDGVSDICDLDDDNDGILDSDEGKCSETPVENLFYMNSLGEELDVYNLNTDTLITLGDSEIVFGDIGMSHEEILYAVEFIPFNFNLYIIDIADASLTFVDNLMGISNPPNALSFDQNGNGYIGFSNSAKVYSFNISDPSGTMALWHDFTGEAPNLVSSGGDFIFVDGVMYATFITTTANANLFKIMLDVNGNVTGTIDLGQITGLTETGYGLAADVNGNLVVLHRGLNNVRQLSFLTKTNPTVVTPIKALRDVVYNGLTGVFEASLECVNIDTDGDGIYDYLDLDSDNDGCSDADEAYANTIADNDDGGIYGPDSPLPTIGNGLVDSNGLVISAGVTGSTYNTIPATTILVDNTFQIATQAAVSIAPTDNTVTVGEAASFSLVATAESTTTYTVPGTPDYTAGTDVSGTLAYQWQVSTDGGTTYTNVIDGGVYSGTNTATLNISDSTGLYGNVYNVIVTHPDNVCINLQHNATLNLLLQDYSDAPISYGDAGHTIVSGIYLGDVPDAEPGPIYSVGADGDGDDEDDITFLDFKQGEDQVIHISTAGTGFLNAWIDWDQSGTFDAGEQVAADVQDNGSQDVAFIAAPSTNNLIGLVIPVPAAATLGDTYVRLRWSTQSGLGPTGLASDGEVEDYLITVVPPTSVCISGSLFLIDDLGTGTSTSSPYILNHTYTAGLVTDGLYDIDNPQNASEFWFGRNLMLDHTNDTNGRVLMINFINSTNDFYKREVTGLPLNTNFEIKTYMRGTCVLCPDEGQISFTILDTSDTVIYQSPVGIPVPNDGNWYERGAIFNTGTNSTIRIVFRNEVSSGVNGNDIIFDDFTLCQLTTTPTDFSDAPISYGDAQHTIVSGIYMGASDADADAASLAGASTDATGDDTDNTDDEDGVTLPVSFTQGLTSTISVTVAGAGAYLQAWIDWDNNGTFDIGEEIAVDIQDGGAGDTDALANGTIVLDVPVPATATVGTSFARFRWSTDDVATLGGAATAMTAAASDGEVEDYEVMIDIACELTTSVVSTETDCSTNTGTATVSVGGGSGTYTYAWSSGDTTSMANNLASGSYTVTVTDTADGCTATASVTVVASQDCNASCDLIATVSSSDESCADNDGSATVTIVSGSGSYTYAWSNGDTTATTNTLVAGTYTVTVTDTGVAGCNMTFTVVVGDGCGDPCDMTAAAVISNETCLGSDGSIAVSVSNGIAPYTYAWSTGGSSSSITGQGAGSYDVTITDANGCSITETGLTIDDNCPCELTTSVVSTETDCSTNTGTATVSVGGGSGSYTYAWSSGDTTSMANNLASGSYTVTVTDTADGCTATASVTVVASQDCNASCDLIATVSSSDESCADNDGSATVTIVSGSGSYTYAWSNGDTTATTNTLVAGTYTVTVTDTGVAGCNMTFTVVVGDGCGDPCDMTAAVVISNETCLGSDGSIAVSVSNGIAPYTYAWSTGGSSSSITGQGAGSYDVTITDANGCSITETGLTIDDNCPCELTTSVVSTETDCSTNTGTATVSVGGGSGTYTYAWSSGDTTSMANNLASGSYTVTVTDTADGCTATASVTVVASQDCNASCDLIATVSSSDESCADNDGSATVTIVSGSGSYTYAWSNGDTTATTNTLVAGTYTVTVTDTGVAGCNMTFTVVVGDGCGDPCDMTAAAVISNETCLGSDGSIAVSVSNGIAPYTYAWSTGGSSSSITGQAAGSYDVTITDANGCSITETGLTIDDNCPCELTTSVVSTETDCSTNTGTATVSVGGGSGTYTYAWSSGDTTSMASNLASGSYTVTITDTADGCTATASVTVVASQDCNASCDLIATVSSSDESCADNDGSATVTIVSGSGSYTYAWSNGDTTATTNTLVAGTYTVTVTDTGVAGCNMTFTVVVGDGCGDPCDMTAAVVISDETCLGSDGSIAVSVSNGIAPYTYAWSTGGSSSSITGQVAGSYDVTITDANGCSITETGLTIDDNCPCELTTSVVSTETDCSTNTGTATVSVGGGSGSYTYAWSSGDTTAMVSNLASGSYTVTVTDTADGCTATASVTVVASQDCNASCDLIATVSSSDESCADNDGSATVTIVSGSGSYTYAWSNGDTTATTNTLVAGTYTVTVTDTGVAGCNMTFTVVVGDGCGDPCDMTAAAVISNETCLGSDGSIAVSVSNGIAPYTYAWSTGGSSSSITGQGAGSYDVTITDANGCSITETGLTIDDNCPCELTTSVVSTETDCSTNTGTATVSVGGGSGTYTYAWSSGDTTSMANNLASGSYTVTVTDTADGCTATASVTVVASQDCNASCDLIATVSSSDESCADNDGSATVTIVSGSGSYTYAWSNGDTTATTNTLVAGTYTVTVTDTGVAGCNMTFTVVVGDGCGDPCDMTAAAVISNETCLGSDGSIAVSVSNGIAPYTYAWSTGGSSSSITGQAAGSYDVTITDANGCSITETGLTIDDNCPCELTTSVVSTETDCSTNTGTATVSVGGGSGTYTYAWSSGDTTPMASNLASGSYTVTVTDTADGCTSTASVTVVASQDCNASCDLIATVSSSDESCADNDGSATVTIVSGSGSYTYAWSNGDTTATTNTLVAGTYTVTVTDTGVAGCNMTFTVVVGDGCGDPCDMTAAAVISNETCLGSDGSIAVSVSNGIAPYTYAWSTGGSSSSITGQGAGSYDVTITDANGCSITETGLTIDDNCPCELTTSVVSTETDCSTNTGTATVSVGGGSGTYTYAWSSGDTTPMASNLASGSYTVTVTDTADGCTATASVTVVASQDCNASCDLIATVSSSDESCADNDGSATVTIVSGSGSYTYAWSNGDTTATTNTLVAGTYTVTVTDTGVAGCNMTFTVVVGDGCGDPCDMTAAVVISNETCLGSDGSIAVSVSNGIAPYTYAWSTGGSSSSITGQGAGSYDVTITDANGCSITETGLTIDDNCPCALTTSVVSTETDCSTNTGTATVSVGGGSGTYTYAWSSGDTTPMANNLASGSYTVTVTDTADGCTATASVTVVASQDCNASCDLIATVSSSDESCADNDGSATVTIVSGSGSYTYAWSNGDTTATTNTLVAGTYTVTVTDTGVAGCNMTFTVVVGDGCGDPCDMTAAVVISSETCLGSDGSIAVSVSNGIAPYTYAWSTGGSSSSITGQGAGSYDVTITDANGCSITETGLTIVSTCPDISLLKTAAVLTDTNGDGVVGGLGDTISYSFTVENTGDVTLTNVIVTDPLVAVVGGPIASMDPGDIDTTTFTATYVIVQTDIDAGVVTNTATVSGDDPGGNPVTDDSDDPSDPTDDDPDGDGDPDDPTDTPLTQNPDISLLKTAAVLTDTNGDGVVGGLGDTISYNFTVENTGDVTLTNVTLTDVLATISGGPIGTLAVGGIDTTTFTATYVITQADIDAGVVTNTATVSGDDPGGNPVTDDSDDPNDPTDDDPDGDGDPDDPTDTPLTQNPDISLLKTAAVLTDTNGDGVVGGLGDTINYSFTVENIGDVTLTNVTLTDVQATVSGGPIATLAVGSIDTTTFTATYVITQADIDAGVVTNTATVSGDDPGGNPVTDDSDDPSDPTDDDPDGDGDPDDPTDTPLTQNPDISLLKTAAVLTDTNGDGVVGGLGDTINYSFTVENTGDVTLTNVTLTDVQATVSGGPIGTLAVGGIDTTTFTATYVITQADIDAGVVTNTATVSGDDPGGNPVTDDSDDPSDPTDDDPDGDGDPDDPTDTPLNQNPDISLLKTAAVLTDTNGDGTVGGLGDTISYNFTVENTGNVTLTNVTLTDVQATVSGGPIGTLAVGGIDTTTFTATYVITQADIDAGVVTNTATVSGDDPGGNPVTDDSDDPSDPTDDDPDGDGDPDDPTDTPLTQNPDISLLKTAAVLTDTNGDGTVGGLGDTISYSFTVENTGDVTLTNVTLTDVQATVSGGPIATLAVGGIDNTTFTATYVITQADIDAGIVTNTATVSGDDPGGNPVTDDSDDPSDPTDDDPDGDGDPDDPTDTPLTQNPDISLLKTAAVLTDTNGDGVVGGLGDTISYSFTVENTGDVTLTNVTLTDVLATVSGGPIATLAVGGIDTTTFTATYVIVQADIDAGVVTNTATVSGDDPGGNPVTDDSDDPSDPTDDDPDGDGDPDDPTDTPLTQNPDISLLKTAAVLTDTNGDGVVGGLGDTISYNFTVENTGDVTLTNVTLTDVQATVSGGPIATLAVGGIDTTTFTATYVIVQADIDAGVVTNTATVSGDDPGGNPVTDDSDDPSDPTDDDPDGDGDPDDPTDTPLTQNPDISLLKTAAVLTDTNGDGVVGGLGDTISYNFTVENTGDVTLTNVIVTDPLVAVVGGPIASMDPGDIDTTTFTATYVIVQADIDAGVVTNTATVSGDDPGGNPVTDDSDDPSDPTDDDPDGDDDPDDPTDTPLTQNPDISLLKTAAVLTDTNGDGTVGGLGDTISYSFTVENTGDVTLTNVIVTDPLVAVVGGPIASMDPGDIDTTTFTATYVITQADIDAGIVTNTATVSGDDPGGNPVTDDSDDPSDPTDDDPDGDGDPDDPTDTPLTQNPDISLLKTAAVLTDTNGDGVVGGLGDTISYSFTVENTGDVTLTNVIVTDPLVAVVGGPIASMDPGDIDTTTFTATYVIVQADIDAGVVTNTATVSGDDPGGNPVTDDSDDPSDPTDDDPDGDGDPDDPTDTPLTQNPDISLLKTAAVLTDTNGDGTVGGLGDTISYSFTVENTGDVTLTNVTISDPLLVFPQGTISGGPIATLAVGGIDTTTFTGSYIITQADIDAGVVTNTATVSGDDPGGNPVTDDSDDPSDPTDDDPDGDGNPDDPTVTTLTLVPTSNISLLKTAAVLTDTNGDGVVGGLGDTINYSFTVENTGNVMLTNVIVTDPLVAVVGGPIASMDPGDIDTTTFTATYVITQTDVDAGMIINVAMVESISPSSAVVVDISDDPSDPSDDDPDSDGDPDDPTVIMLDQIVFDLMVEKTVDNPTPMVGEEVTFTITITNVGQQTATLIEVEELLPSGYSYVIHTASAGIYTESTGLWSIDQLDPDQSESLNITVEVLGFGDYLNTATVVSSVGGVDENPSDDSDTGEVEPLCLIIYNEFSPNGDGTNEFFVIDCIEQYPNNTLKVYNRWGNVVYQANGYLNDWDGTSNGRATVNTSDKLPVGTYYYVLDIGDGSEPRVGWLYINR